MKTYHGERTERGCEVTVDGEPLRLRSDLSGNATNDFDWGFIGTGQLSLALLSDFLGDDPKAKALCPAFEKQVVAELRNPAWTLTGKDVASALADIAVNDPEGAGTASVDMPIDTVETIVPSPLPDNAAPRVRARTTTLIEEIAKSPEEHATELKAQVVTQAAGEMASVANQVVAAAMAVGKAAHQVAHAGDRPADEPMSTANRAADQKADATNRAVDEAAALARSAVDEANRVAAKLVANAV